MTLKAIRSEFPELSVKIYGKPLVYLDNAATSQRPIAVISKMNEMSLEINANIHRAVHFLAGKATDEFERTRSSMSRFLGAASEKEIVFTSGTTQSINLLAYSFGEAVVKEGDEIIVSEAEHHSNIVPWQILCERKKAILKVVPVDESGRLKLDELEKAFTERTRLVSLTHVSNVLGLVNPIREIAEICHRHSCPLSVDGAQGIVHQTVDVAALDCDFYSFSGHKLYAATGTGVLYGKKRWLDIMPPYMGGGEMIESVSWNQTTYSDIPHRFEAGTQNIAAIPTLVPAVEMASALNSGEIHQEAENVKCYVYEQLTSRSDIALYGRTDNLEEKIPVFSFCVDGVHHEDLALLLDKMGIAVRSGQMCAEPLMNRYGKTGMLRASFAPYNTMEEAEYFVSSLDRAIRMLR